MYYCFSKSSSSWGFESLQVTPWKSQETKSKDHARTKQNWHFGNSDPRFCGAKDEIPNKDSNLVAEICT